MAGENRKDIRYGVFIHPLHCFGSDDSLTKVNVNDISTSGMGISTSVRLVKAQKIELEVIMPGDKVPLFVHGEVIWIRNDKRQDDVYFAGVKFGRLSRCDRERIVSYIKETFY